jgi:hypothetical protein
MPAVDGPLGYAVGCAMDSEECPYCLKPIRAGALKCPHCGKIIDEQLRSAREMSASQGDGIGLISIACAALALVGTISGMLCFGYGAAVAIPIAITGIITALFAGKYRSEALTLNFLALVPPILVVLLVSIVGFSALSACCFLPFAAEPQPNPVAVAPVPNVAPKKQVPGVAKNKVPAPKDDNNPQTNEPPTVENEGDAIEAADKLYQAGNHAAAVARYKDNYLAVEPKSEAEILRRIVEYEVGKGNTKEARRWVELGLEKGLAPAYTSPAVTKLVAQVRLELEQRAAKAKAEREAEERAKWEPRVRKALADLQSPNAKTRVAAVRAVAELGERAKDAAPTLAGLLSDTDCQKDAANALGRIGKAAVPHLLKVLEGKDAVARMWAVRALDRIGPDAQEAVPALEKARSDPSVSVRDAAKAALENVRK